MDMENHEIGFYGIFQLMAKQVLGKQKINLEIVERVVLCSFRCFYENIARFLIAEAVFVNSTNLHS